MTNKEWLDYLAHNAPDELSDWFDAEHVETEERALDGDTDALERKSADLIHEYYKPMVAELRTERMAERAYWHNQMHAILDMLNGKERFWGACMEYPLDELTIPPSEVAQSLFQKRIDECDELQKQVDELTAERERYRSKFGKCLDYADAIHALMDDEGMA